MGRLQQTMTAEQAGMMKGIYNFAQKVYNMPCAFITPITISAIPAITALITKGDSKGAKETAESAARVTALIAAPCTVGLMVVAQPVMAVLRGYTGEKLALATQLMTVLAACILFNALVLMTTALLQAHGHVNRPVINMFIGGILKLAAVFILTGNPHIGIIGTPIGSLLCYVSITVLNLVTIKQVVPDSPAIVKNLLRAVLAAVVMGGAVWLTQFGLSAWLGQASGRSLTSVVLCAVPIAVGAVVYLVAAIGFKAITRSDCELLPKGEKIAKLLRL
jgi:stage V sporulation protein B